MGIFSDTIFYGLHSYVVAGRAVRDLMIHEPFFLDMVLEDVRDRIRRSSNSSSARVYKICTLCHNMIYATYYLSDKPVCIQCFHTRKCIACREGIAVKYPKCLMNHRELCERCLKEDFEYGPCPHESCREKKKYY